MRIEKSDLIVGRPAKEMRDALRKLLSWNPKHAVARAFNTEPDAVDALIKELLERRLLETDVFGTEFRYRAGPEGLRLASANFNKRITRIHANKLVSDLIERAKTINARDDLTHFVQEIRVFGSYLEDTPDLGDIDIAVQLGQRAVSGDWIAACLARAELSGRRFNSHFDRLTYSQKEVMKMLTGKQRAFSVHYDIAGIEKRGWRSQTLFKLETAPASVVTARSDIGGEGTQ